MFSFYNCKPLMCRIKIMPQILEKCSFSEAEENFISFLLRYEDVCMYVLGKDRVG